MVVRCWTCARMAVAGAGLLAVIVGLAWAAWVVDGPRLWRVLAEVVFSALALVVGLVTYACVRGAATGHWWNV